MDSSLATQIIARSTRPQSHDHGEQHWKAVAWAGLGLASQVEGCDAQLVCLFALFHDSQRFNEFHDPEHGERRLAEGKSRREANRCLKRYLARNLYRLLDYGPPTAT